MLSSPYITDRIWLYGRATPAHLLPLDIFCTSRRCSPDLSAAFPIEKGRLTLVADQSVVGEVARTGMAISLTSSEGLLHLAMTRARL